MKSIRRGIALLLAAVLIIPNMPAFAEEPVPIIDFSTLETQQEEAPGSDNADEKLPTEETAADSSGAEQTSTEAAPTESGPAESSASNEPIPTESASSEVSSNEAASNEATSSEVSPSETTTTEVSSSEGTTTEVSSSEVSSSEAASTEASSSEPSSSESASTEVSSTEASSTETSTEMGSTEAVTETELTTETETDSTELTTETVVSTETEIETEEEKTLLATELEEVFFNTGNKVMRVSNEPLKGDIELSWDEFRFDENGAFTIHIPEQNPFFPYEVQFTYNGETSSKWFMTPEDCIEVGGHPFYVAAEFDGNVVTRMNLNVAGTKVVVYPKAKEFTDDATSSSQVYSLLPLEERTLNDVDLSAFTPAELTMVHVEDIFKGKETLKSTDKIVWAYGEDGDRYEVSLASDTLDLSCATCSGSGSVPWQMIVKNDDQLDTSNIRYVGRVKVTSSDKWLDATVYTQNDKGQRKNIAKNAIEYDDWSKTYRRLKITASVADMGSEMQAYISLKVNPETFAQTNYAKMKVFEGNFRTVEETEVAFDITDKILNANMAQMDAGYIVPVEDDQEHWVTLVTYNASGNATGCLPFNIQLKMGDRYIYNSLYQGTGKERPNVLRWNEGYSFLIENLTWNMPIKKQYALNGKYYLVLKYEKDGKESNKDITAVYIGKFNSIAEAKSANAQEVKDFLFNSDPDTGGYEADYSDGITFSIFIGEDGSEDQEKRIWTFKTFESVETTEEPSLSDETLVRFIGISGLRQEDIYSVYNQEDSYGDYNYLTMVVGPDVDLTNLAPTFDEERLQRYKIKLYTDKGLEVSGVSTHDFSKGPVHYTASSESKERQRNYWLQIVKATEGAGTLYVNSLADPESKTKIEDGVVYTKREALIDSYHGDIHDILLINMGTSALKELSAELSSSTLEMDEYWTLKGKFELSGFTTTQKTEDREHGELPNMAKIRLRKKAGVSENENVSGTLRIKSGSQTLMEFELTGTMSDPRIITTDIPKAVKYVPYGFMIQNNNKYSWNQVTYTISDGKLPDGVVVKPNGEIYGVPKEAGSFKFEVTMRNSNNGRPSKKTLTLEVLENTDKNVNAATDIGYTVLQRIPNISRNNKKDRLFVSEGVFTEFVDVYLDGNKLTKGVDYDAESGSTRITIKAETLDQDLGKGTHTLGVEFRVDGDENKELKRAAQNFKIKSGSDKDDQKENNNQDNNEGGSGEGEKHHDNTSSSTSSAPAPIPVTNVVQPDANTVIPNTDAANTIVNPTENSEVISYTIEPGDTLWKIAAKFYGDGNYWQKIYEDNADTISNPDRIFAGQVIRIYPLQDALNAAFTNPTAGNPAQLPQTNNATADSTGMNTYVVQPGDNLWKIARKLYGRGWRWRIIYEANADTLPDPGQLHVGQVLVIPN